MTFDARTEMTASGLWVNPGSGPVDGTSVTNAEANITAFANDVEECYGVRYEIQRDTDADDDGRYGYVLVSEGDRVSVDMPGLPLEEVRFLGTEGQNIWDYPRLYVEGSSWVWKYALGRLDPQERSAN